jgi:protein-S-isoprenylcysteine O-methyltransferase Ste14
MNLKFLSVAAFIVLVIAILGLIKQEAIVANGLIAITVQTLAVLLMVWARLTFGKRSFHASADPTEGGLITSGPYRFLRHPIYAAIFYFFWAAILSHMSIINFCLGIVATAGIMIRIFSEERLLIVRYPEYIAYAARTKRIIPFVF